MSVHVLLDQFPLLASAPEGVKRLRELILELAVRGKLVQQDRNDEPASELLKRIQAEKVKLAAEGKIKKDKPLPEICEVEKPFELPEGWEWARLADIVEVLNGRAYAKGELLIAGTPVLRVGNLFTSSHWYYSDLELDEGKYCDAGDLIFSWSASFGPFIWPGPKVIYHYHIWKLQPHREADTYREYLNKFLLEKTQEIKAAGHGVSMLHMTKEKMEKVVVPMPPIPEQHRIVAKVDELMALCDQLEAQQTDAASAHATLVNTLLGTFTQGQTSADFTANWQRLAQHFDTLITTEASIVALQQTILQLAVMGKLVSQDPNDEPASELLNRIRKAIPHGKIDAAVVEPFHIPHGWKWERLQSLLVAERDVSYGVIKLGIEPSEGVVPTLWCSDVKPGSIDLSGVRNVSEEIESEYKRTRLIGGEILLNIRGTLGGVALVPVELAGYNVAREVAVIPVSRELSGKYLIFVMLSMYFWQAIQNDLRGIAYKGLNLGSLRTFLIPLPPLAEQHRIVAKVDELMALCDHLASRLKAARELSATFATAATEAVQEAA